MGFVVLFDTVRHRKLSFLLRDDFITADAAPLTSPRTCEPGPGTLTITDSNNRLSIASGELAWSGSQGTNDPIAWADDPFTRAAGLLAYCTYRRVSGIVSQAWRYGFDSQNLVGPNHCNFRDNSTANIVPVVASAVSITTGLTFSDGVDYHLAVILRSSGTFFLLLGGAFTNWTLIWVDNALTSDPLYLGSSANNPTSFVRATDSWRVINLPSNGYTIWGDDYGIITDRETGSVAAGTTFTHEADFLMEWVQTVIPGLGADTRIAFRRQDANNFWRIAVDGNGSLKLEEVVAGVATNRGSAGTVLAGHRIVIIAEGATIRCYSNNVLLISYTSATNFQTQTAGVVEQLGLAPGVVTDLTTWPRVLSIANSAGLEAVRNA